LLVGGAVVASFVAFWNRDRLLGPRRVMPFEGRPDSLGVLLGIHAHVVAERGFDVLVPHEFHQLRRHHAGFI
jgi:hypothetical protein